MKFSLSVHPERTDPRNDVREALRSALDLVRMADQGGFEIAWTPEHHMIECTIGPNPFTTLIHWAAHTSRIRLGTATVVAPYWHPIRLAAEAALCDQLSDGRLEFGIARGAFQYEFDRMADGMPQHEGGAHLREILPVVLNLWQGDYAHDGALYRFPNATSVPKPLQTPHPPLWIAARDPDTFDFTVGIGANVMSTPLSKPFEEVLNLWAKFETAVAAHPERPVPRWMVLRRTCVYDSPDDWELPVRTTI